MLKKQYLTSKSLCQHMAELTAAISNEDKWRWSNGECHSFAIALADYVRALVPESSADVYLLVGTRYGLNPETRRHRRYFSHVVVAVQFGDELVAFDGEYTDNIDARLAWESKWFDDAISEHVISMFNQLGAYDWRDPDWSNSSFSWEAVVPDPRKVTLLVRKIDNSRGPTPDSIEYARQRLQQLVI